MPKKARRERDKELDAHRASRSEFVVRMFYKGCNDDLMAKGYGLWAGKRVMSGGRGEVYQADIHPQVESSNKAQHDKQMQTAQALKLKHADIWDKRGSSTTIQNREARNGNTISTRTIRAYQKLLAT